MMKSKSQLMIVLTAILALFLIESVYAQRHSETLNTQLDISNGTIEGVEEDGITVFRGIPFAEPPTGNRRWTAPVDKEPWDGVLETKVFGPACMQLPVFGDMNFRSDGNSEDCLYLNVWTPAKTGNEKLPVLLYYYGGGFMAGDGSEPRYDGANMARDHKMVAITTNYRLGVFGFFAHPELTQESSHNSSGNYGLLDQVKALEWVVENIEKFGGDPDNITIAGESAGSISVSALMASPLSRDMIAGAIGESGSILGALPPVELEVGEQNGEKFAGIIGAESLQELREIPSDSLLNLTGQQGLPRFAPTIDGYYFPKPPLEIFEAGEHADVPLFVGWNSQEMNFRAFLGQHEPTIENYKKVVASEYESHASRILELYPAGNLEEMLQSATDLAGDRFIAFSTWKWADLHQKNSTSPVYQYYYTQPRPKMRPKYANSTPGFAGGVQENDESAEDEMQQAQLPEPNGAVHSAEIEYLMGNLSSNRVYDWTETDYKVSAIFQNYAANFIHSKSPNGYGVPFWPAADQTGGSVMSIGSDTFIMEDPFGERYEFLDQLMIEN
ncbi:MAG: carboxylesterase family protein [Balneolaceae bacterium]|nr:carboxylesterase family protein [Balneolaceae bacterium]